MPVAVFSLSAGASSENNLGAKQGDGDGDRDEGGRGGNQNTAVMGAAGFPASTSSPPSEDCRCVLEAGAAASVAYLHRVPSVLPLRPRTLLQPCAVFPAMHISDQFRSLCTKRQAFLALGERAVAFSCEMQHAFQPT